MLLRGCPQLLGLVQVSSLGVKSAVIQSSLFKGAFFLRAEKHRLFAAFCSMTRMACVYAGGLAASASNFDADGWMRTPNSTMAEDWTERYNVTVQLANGGFSTGTNVSLEESGELFLVKDFI